jgi:hypothetical protein
MGIMTSLQQKEEIDQSATYDDSLNIANAEVSATNIEDDLNYIRSLLKSFSGQTNWNDALTENIETLAARAKLENKLVVADSQLLTDVTVGGSDNWVVLVAASSETPSQVIALNVSTKGAVCAQLAGAVGSNDLAEVAGINAINPKNLVKIVDGVTKDPILSGGKEIMGLLQVSSTASDNTAFDDTNNKGQISFVRVNSAGNDLEACPAADIQGKTINYLYRFRTDLNTINEQYFAGGNFTDQTAAVDVTLDNAIDNQSGAVSQSQSIDVRITDTYEFQFSDSGGNAIATIKAEAAGDTFEIGDGSNAADFKGFGKGEFVDELIVDTGGTVINIGLTAGRIDATALELESTTGDLNLDSAAELKFADSRQTTGIPLTDAVASTLIGGPFNSLFAAINAARSAGVTLSDRKDTNTNTSVAATTLIQYNGGGGNIDAVLCDYWDTDIATTKINFTSNVMIWINGVYRRPGPDAAENNDVYPSTVQAEAEEGAFYCEKALKSSANIMMLLFA